MAKKVIQIGIPGALITVLMSVANIVLNNYIGIYGSDAVASYGIAYKIDMFPIMLSVGLSQGTAPLLGYYFGKSDDKNLSKAMGTATVYGIILGAGFTAILVVGSRVFAGIFLSDEALIVSKHSTTNCVRITPFSPNIQFIRTTPGINRITLRRRVTIRELTAFPSAWK